MWRYRKHIRFQQKKKRTKKNRVVDYTKISTRHKYIDTPYLNVYGVLLFLVAKEKAADGERVTALTSRDALRFALCVDGKKDERVVVSGGVGYF